MSVLYDALESRFQRVRVQRDDSCLLCGSSPEITELIDYEESSGMERSDV